MEPYGFTDDVALHYVPEQDSNDRSSAEDVLLQVLDELEEKALSVFAVRLALTMHRGVPNENDPDLLKEAAQDFGVNISSKPAKKTPPMKQTAKS